MTNDQKNIIRDVARLREEDRRKVLGSSDSDLPDTLRELGVSLPATNWVLRILKALLYAAGIILAGVGTMSCATGIM